MDILGLVDVPLTVLLLVAIVSLLYVYGKWNLTLLSDHGIRGPKPTMFLGNTLEMNKKGLLPSLDAWIKEYGNVFGLYFGKLPGVVVLDLEILKEVFVKDFQNFSSRSLMRLQQYPLNTGVFFESGASWRRIRNIITPTFSGGKLKLMSDWINESAVNLQKNFMACSEQRETVNVKEYFGAYTMDVIASTAFGIKVDSQHDFDNPFVKNAKKVFDTTFLQKSAFLIGSIIPPSVPLLKALGFAAFPNDCADFFIKTIKEMTERRKQDKSIADSKHVDFLQLLLNAESNELKSNKKLSTDEIIGQAFLFFIAGYETTASTLQFVTYCLATNPDVQDKLVDEINSVLGNKEPNYDNITKLTYLDCVLNETLRLYPPVGIINREIAKTVTIKGVTLPKGAAVFVPIYHIQRLADYYPDPERFKPERFSTKADMNPVSFLSFGYGPRLCVGMRLALMEAKIALVHVLRKVKFVKSEDTPDEIKFKGGGLLIPEKPIQLRVEPRVIAV